MHFIQEIKKIASVKRNVSSLVLLSVVIALVQFCVYTLINKILGKEVLGIWSLVAAGVAFGQIGNFGLSSSLVRFLPEMIAENRKDQIQKIIGTLNAVSFILVLPITVILYFPAEYYGRILLDDIQFRIFRPVMMVALFALFVSNISLIYSFSLDALQKHFLRSYTQIAGWILFLILSVFLMPEMGLLGVSIALLAQSIFQVAVLLILFRNTGTIHRFFPFAFDRYFFKKTYAFGLKSQSIGIISLFFDPLIKYFITRNGGLAVTANYEVANKIAMQLRNLLVAANQVIIPKVVIHQSQGTIAAYFKRAFGGNNILAVTTGMVNIFIAPLAVFLFAKPFDWMLFQAIIVLNLGWTVNSLTSIHYFAAIGTDKIGRLVICHVLQSVSVLVLYFIVPNHFAGLVYFIIPSVALVAGSVYNSTIFTGSAGSVFGWVKSGFFHYFLVSTVIVIVSAQFVSSSVLIPGILLPVLYGFAILRSFKKLADTRGLMNYL